MAVLPEGDPHGDRQWLEEQRKRRKKGRGALLTDAEEFEPTKLPDEDAEGDEAGGGGGGGGGDDGDDGEGEKRRRYRSLRIQRIGPEGYPVFTPIDLVTSVSSPCPVQVLGVKDGAVFALDPLGQLRTLSENFGQGHLRMLFGSHCGWLDRHFPQFSQQKTWKGFQAQYAAQAIIQEAFEKGPFDAREKVRGLGCWRGEEGQLIQHLGDQVLVGDQLPGAGEKPGEIGEHVYPGRPKILPPVPDPTSPGKMTAAQEVFDDFRGWTWARGDLDARLLLGWIGCAILGAALDWRPMIFMTGDAGTGKSTLQERLKKLLPGRLASTVDASPAALRQIINQDAIGVSFDEIEADVLNDSAQMVMKLARVAASGGTVFRGGKDHNAAEFQLRGCFAFSAIVPPSMRQQDMQRLTFLRLYQLRKGQKLARRTDAEWRALGQRLAGRIVAGWGRWDDTLEAYERGLMDVGGHNQRGARQFGTLLAAADLLLHDDVPADDVVAGLIEGLQRDRLYEYEQADPTWLVTWRHILSAQPEVWRSSSFPTVAEVVRDYMLAINDQDRAGPQKKLNRVGLAIVTERRTGKRFLAIPPKHQRIAEIFAGSDLRAHGGEGAWTAVLRGAPAYDRETNPDGVWRADNVPALGRVKCTQIRLDAVVDLQGVKTPIFDVEPPEDNEDTVVPFPPKKPPKSGA